MAFFFLRSLAVGLNSAGRREGTWAVAKTHQQQNPAGSNPPAAKTPSSQNRQARGSRIHQQQKPTRQTRQKTHLGSKQKP